jgi:D-serine deaminase-like pyridoxal phosphate-dependent protein
MSPGPNRELVGGPVDASGFSTPALLIDRDAFETNLAAMATLVKRHGRKLRPHVKAHKSPDIARQQIAAGAIGLCCATVREVEVMAGAGLDGILLTTSVVSSGMIERLVRVREAVAELSVVADSVDGVERLAASADVSRPIGVLVEIDMGQTRTGVIEVADAVAIAQRISQLPQLAYRGVQAYYGHLQHVPTLAERRAKVAEKTVRLKGFLDALRRAGLPAEIVSGSGTGTHLLDLEGGVFTELQAGSYIFMDKQYGAVELAPGASPFRTSLFVAARVVSTVQPDRVIVDAGFKAMATDAGPAAVASGAPVEATYQFMGDEHGALRFAPGAIRPALGDLVTLVAPHCDPTVNLHDRFHVVRDGQLTDIWPIVARGY